jgi:hypothetical protein
MKESQTPGKGSQRGGRDPKPHGKGIIIADRHENGEKARPRPDPVA